MENINSAQIRKKCDFIENPYGLLKKWFYLFLDLKLIYHNSKNSHQSTKLFVLKLWSVGTSKSKCKYTPLIFHSMKLEQKIILSSTFLNHLKKET